jgi:hypothetical protein
MGRIEEPGGCDRDIRGTVTGLTLFLQTIAIKGSC